MVLCGSFYLPPLFEENKGGRGENNPFEMKKLAPGWKAVIGLFQKDQHSRPVNKSFCRQAQGMVVLPECGAAGWPLASSCHHVPRPVVCKDFRQPNKLIPARALEPLLGTLSFLSVGRVGVLTHSRSWLPATGKLEFLVLVAVR